MTFPCFKQLDKMDCGPSCLRIVAKFYGKNFSLQSLREKCFITRDGVSLLGISEAAETIGIRTQAGKFTWEQFRDEMPLPCIVHWRQNHFVVVYDIKKKDWRHRKDTVFVSDPAHGLIDLSADDFQNGWLSSKENGEGTGIAMILEPTPRFYTEENDSKDKLSFEYLINYLRPYSKFIIQLLLSLLTGSMISLIFPFITQSVVDYGISNSDLNFIFVALIAQVALTFGQMANDLIRSWLMLHMTTRISISFVSDFLFKLMRLPISYFDVKMTGDIMQRINDNSRIQSFLTGTLLSMTFSILTFVIYSVLMASYNIPILIIFLFGSFLYTLWVFLFLKKRKKLDYRRFNESAKNSNSLIQLINGMQEIKLNCCEKQKRWEWERIQAQLYKVSIKSLVLGQTQQVGGLFIDQGKNVLVSFLAAKAVIDGDMTFGMMVAMQYILGQLNAPISQFIGLIQATQDARISLERLNEVYNLEDEEPEDSEKISEIPSCSDLIIQNVSYQYEGPLSPKVLDDVSLTIPAHKITAIVGTSGSGKTTLIKLLLGFYKPTTGKIELEKQPLEQYRPSAWRRVCGIVMQEGYVFSDTLANNIGVVDEVVDIKKVEHAVKVANLQDLIDQLPNKYKTKIGADGQGLSTGQKQRMFIARAVYKDPLYIFFDEATNSLDSNNERVIMENMKQFFSGRTVVVVAHRLSTVKNADQIVVLEKGKIEEIGTHHELIGLKGKYYHLVKDQLELGD